MTATVVPTRTKWWDANGDLIQLISGRQGDKWVPKHDAALASLMGGPADGRAAVCIRGKRPPAVVGKQLRDGTHAWYTLDVRPPKLTYQFAGVLRGWPRVVPA